MSATQSWSLGTGVSVELECDGCGVAFGDTTTRLADWPALWRAARKAGWQGLPRASGPHRCPECVTLLRRPAAGPVPTGSLRFALSPAPVSGRAGSPSSGPGPRVAAVPIPDPGERESSVGLA